MKNATWLLGFCVLFFGCSKDFSGEALPNQAPETGLTADTIARSGDNRYPSLVHIEWWGDDPDGFIKGFEFTLDGNTWHFTDKQDSTFTLALPGSSDTFDFNFQVRAVDNLGLADASPASLIYPVKNSPPTVRFIIPAGTPSRSFPAVKYFWEASDPDGNSSIDHYELVWNDTATTPLSLGTTFTEVGLVAKLLTGSVTDCSVYPGTLTNPSANVLPGMLLGADNILYIRVLDKVGAASHWIASPTIFIRKPSSDILFVNGQRSPFNRANIQNFYTGKISQTLNKAFDTLQAGPEGGAHIDLSADPVTQDRVFSFFKKIFIYSENSEFVLSLMQRSSQRFFMNGGKLLLITEGNDGIEDKPLYLDFTPMASYTARPTNVSLLFNMNDSLLPLPPSYPTLVNPGILSGIRPFELAGNNSNFQYQALYEGIITADSAGNLSLWKGNSVLSAKRIRLSDNKTDFVIMMIPVYALKNDANMDAWFQKMLVDELDF